MAKAKTHKLKDTQASLLHFVRNHQQAIFSGILSTIAMDLGYTVTDKTQFTLKDDLTELTMSELEAPEPEEDRDLFKADK